MMPDFTVEELSISTGVSKEVRDHLDGMGRRMARLMEESYLMSCIEYEWEHATKKGARNEKRS